MITFRVNDYQFLKDNNQHSLSQQFYTSTTGYNLQLKVYANGIKEANNTHLSVYVIILKGDFDERLNWPFVGEITVTLLNQLEDENHINQTVDITLENNALVGNAWGFEEFVAHSELVYVPDKNTQYLMDDTLYFSVSANISNYKPWLECKAQGRLTGHLFSHSKKGVL